jgi:hypothetical protein
MRHCDGNIFATPCRIRIDVAKICASLHTVAKTLQNINGFKGFAEMNSHALTSEISASASNVDDRRLRPRSQLGRSRPIVDISGSVVGAYTNLMTPLPSRQYRFEIGQQVQWGDKVWTVAGRETSAMGRRFYIVQREGDVRPIRTAIEVVLASLA